MEEQTVNNPIQQPTIPTSPEPKHHSFLTSKIFLTALVILVLFTIVYAGIYLYLGSQLDQISKSNQTATTQPSPTQDPTVNWKTYRNKELGFEVRYPDIYENNQACSPHIVDGNTRDAIVFLGPIIISKVDTDGLSMEQYVEKIVREIQENKDNYRVSELDSQKSTTFAKKNAIQVISKFCGASCSNPTNIYVDNNGDILKINYDDGIINQCPFNSYKLPSKVADQILATLKFLNLEQAIDTSNWKTYRNEEFGFEVRHPLDWLFLEEKIYVGISPCTLEQDIRDKPFVCGLLTFHKKIQSGSLNDLLENQYSEQQGFAIIDKRKLEQFTLVKMGVQASIAQHYLLYDAQRKKTIELTNREGLIEEKIFDQILSTFKFTDQDQVVCTQDVKECPDGSYVSRQGPNCEFAACP